MSKRLLLVLLLLSLSFISIGYGQWTPDGVVVCCSDVAGYQELPVTIVDGKGGAIIVWPDSRDWATNYWDMYVQRVDSAGYLGWLPAGVALCETLGSQVLPRMVPDEAGGAIVAWEDHRGASWDIYAQRVDSSGNTMWQRNGIAVRASAGEQSYLDMIQDGDGGAIITWNDTRSGGYDIYVQRIDGDGGLLWSPPGGVPVCTASGWQVNPDAATDGHNGAIITWQDERADTYDIYVQRVDRNGVCRWTPDGVPVCTAGAEQEYPEITLDGMGGALIVWQDGRPAWTDIYAQRVDSTGAICWTIDGVPVCTAPNLQWHPKLVSDSAGGAIVVWGDARDAGLGGDIYAQRLDNSGSSCWAPDGVPVCTTSYESEFYSGGDLVVSDGIGGAVITWWGPREPPYDYDIWAQRVNGNGEMQWQVNGVLVCGADNDQRDPALASDGKGGAIVAWTDHRDMDWPDIYAQRVDSSGIVGTGLAETGPTEGNISKLEFLHNRPNPFQTQTVIEYQILEACHVRLTFFNALGQEVRVLVDDEVVAGKHSLLWDGRDNQERKVAGGVYFCRLERDDQSETRRVVLLR